MDALLHLHYILLVTPSHTFLSPPFAGNLSTSLLNVHLQASCLSPFGFKTSCLATALSVFWLFGIFLSDLSCPLCPLGRLEVCHCLALRYVVWTTSGGSTDSVSIGETSVGLYSKFSVFFFLLLSPLPVPFLDGRSYVCPRPPSVLSAPSLLVSGWGDGVGHRTCNNSSPLP